MKPEPSFYIGYIKKTPPDLAAFNRRIVFALGIIVIAVAGAAAALQRPFDASEFEFGKVTTYEGVMYQLPVPMLHTSKGDIILVGAGKHGISDSLRAIDAKKVRFDGTLLYWKNMKMVEVTRPETFKVLGDPSPGEDRPRTEVVGSGTFDGEIVDTKCFFGAMRPGCGKVHRGCAIRCLSGGTPPGLLIRDEQGGSVVFLLTGADGGPLKYDIEWAARPVRAQGIFELHDKVPVLRIAKLELLKEAAK